MKKISLLIMLVVLSGCTVQNFHLTNDSALAEGGPKIEKTSHFFFWGLVPADDISLATACASGKVSDIVSKQTFVDGLLNAITYGIYVPRTYIIYCKA